MLSSEQRSLLQDATRRYHHALPESPAAEHLAKRGLGQDRVKPFLLGYVAEPLPEHTPYRGMLAIPYLRRNGHNTLSVVSMRFRCIEDHEHQGHGKYNTVPGDTGRLFNTIDIVENDQTIAICEGEMDAVAAHVAGIGAVGIPGAQIWKPYFTEPFIGFETVWVLADGDPAGRSFGDTVAKKVSSARVVSFPEGHDVNSFIVTYGAEALKEKLK